MNNNMADLSQDQATVRRRRQSEVDFAPSTALEGRNVKCTSTMIKVTYNKPINNSWQNTLERLDASFDSYSSFDYLPYFAEKPSPVWDLERPPPTMDDCDPEDIPTIRIIVAKKTPYKAPSPAEDADCCPPAVTPITSSNKENEQVSDNVLDNNKVDTKRSILSLPLRKRVKALNLAPNDNAIDTLSSNLKQKRKRRTAAEIILDQAIGIDDNESLPDKPEEGKRQVELRHYIKHVKKSKKQLQSSVLVSPRRSGRAKTIKAKLIESDSDNDSIKNRQEHSSNNTKQEDEISPSKPSSQSYNVSDYDLNQNSQQENHKKRKGGKSKHTTVRGKDTRKSVRSLEPSFEVQRHDLNEIQEDNSMYFTERKQIRRSKRSRGQQRCYEESPAGSSLGEPEAVPVVHTVVESQNEESGVKTTMLLRIRRKRKASSTIPNETAKNLSDETEFCAIPGPKEIQSNLPTSAHVQESVIEETMSKRRSRSKAEFSCVPVIRVAPEKKETVAPVTPNLDKPRKVGRPRKTPKIEVANVICPSTTEEKKIKDVSVESKKSRLRNKKSEKKPDLIDENSADDPLVAQMAQLEKECFQPLNVPPISSNAALAVLETNDFSHESVEAVVGNNTVLMTTPEIETTNSVQDILTNALANESQPTDVGTKVFWKKRGRKRKETSKSTAIEADVNSSIIEDPNAKIIKETDAENLILSVDESHEITKRHLLEEANVSKAPKCRPVGLRRKGKKGRMAETKVSVSMAEDFIDNTATDLPTVKIVDDPIGVSEEMIQPPSVIVPSSSKPLPINDSNVPNLSSEDVPEERYNQPSANNDLSNIQETSHSRDSYQQKKAVEMEKVNELLMENSTNENTLLDASPVSVEVKSHYKKKEKHKKSKHESRKTSPFKEDHQPSESRNDTYENVSVDSRRCVVVLRKLSNAEGKSRDESYEAVSIEEQMQSPSKKLKLTEENRSVDKKEDKIAKDRNRSEEKSPAKVHSSRRSHDHHRSHHKHSHKRHSKSTDDPAVGHDKKKKSESVDPSVKRKSLEKDPKLGEKSELAESVKQKPTREPTAGVSPISPAASATHTQYDPPVAIAVNRAHRPKSLDEKPPNPKHEQENGSSAHVRSKAPKPELATIKSHRDKVAVVPTTPQTPKDGKGVVRIVQVVDLFGGLMKPQVRKERKEVKAPVKKPVVVPSLFAPDAPYPAPSHVRHAPSRPTDESADSELPPGWTRLVHTRQNGVTKGKRSVVFISPNGKKFGKKSDLEKYLKENQLPFKVNQFSFSVTPRPQALVNLQCKASLYKGKTLTKTVKTKKHLKKTLKTINVETAASTRSPEVVRKLPGGWKCVTRVRRSGGSAGRIDTLYYTPEGRRLRSKPEIARYLMESGSTLALEDFFSQDKQKSHSDSVPSSKIDEGVNPAMDQSKCSAQEHLQQTVPDGDIMYDDPTLPAGWKREIHIRQSGDSLGRLEVYIISPDGRRLSSKKKLKHYLETRNLPYDPEEFDFTRHGRKKPPESGKKKAPVKISENAAPQSKSLKKFKQTLEIRLNNLESSVDLTRTLEDDSYEGNSPVPGVTKEEWLNLYRKLESPSCNTLRTEIDEESHECLLTNKRSLIEEVRAVLIATGLSSSRAERRLATLHSHMEPTVLQAHVTGEEATIPAGWIQSLLSCRPELPGFDDAAVLRVASATEYFIQCLASRAHRRGGESELHYRHVADLVANTPSLAPLRPLIPQQVTFARFKRLSRPSQFFSFTL